jgi:DNA polymerase, archaea type
MNFADFHAAEMVTGIGRNIIRRMRDWLTSRGCQVIELDTDGICFHKPAELHVEELSRDLNTSLPQGIEVAFDRFYEAMFSYKKKNAAFLLADGAVHLKGGSLRSRAREPFLVRYTATAVRLLLTNLADEIPALFEATLSAVRNRELPLEDFLTKQTLKESLDEYRERVDSGRRNPSAAYEAVIANGMTTTRGDRVAFYVALPPDGEKKNVPAYKRAKLATASTNGACGDLDVEAYVKKLLHTAKMFDAFAPRQVEEKI